MRIAVIAPTEIPARRANTIQVTKMTQAFTTLGHTTLLVSPFNPSSKEYLNQNKIFFHTIRRKSHRKHRPPSLACAAPGPSVDWVVRLGK